MKKAAKILLLISGILSIVCAVSFFIVGVVYLALGASVPFLVELLNSGAMPNDSGMPVEEYAPILAGTLIGVAVWMLVCAAFAVASAIISFKARNTDKKALFIVTIVLSVFSMTTVGIVGGIFGLIVGDTLD